MARTGRPGGVGGGGEGGISFRNSLTANLCNDAITNDTFCCSIVLCNSGESEGRSNFIRKFDCRNLSDLLKEGLLKLVYHLR